MSTLSKLRMNGGLENENKMIARQLLLPLSRSLATNWSLGNRREAGVVLAHVTGSGQEAASIVSAMSKLLKKVCDFVFYFRFRMSHTL